MWFIIVVCIVDGSRQFLSTTRDRACVGHVLLFALLYALGYFFDCVDGIFARRYGMTSRLGDMYDHVTDVTVTIGVLIIVMKKKKRPITWHPVAVLLIALAFFIVSMGCQQRKKSNQDDESLDITKPACRDEEWITWTRFLGPTTFYTVVVLVVIYLFQEKQPT